MSRVSRKRSDLASAVLRLLVAAYPRDFRRAHGREMVQIFELQRRENRYRGVTGAPRFWIDVVIDAGSGALRRWIRSTPAPAHAAPPGTVMTVHPSREGNAMDILLQDLRYALRTLVKSPGWSAAAVLTLALGLGSTTAVFSLVHDLLLRPLPYEAPDRLQVLKGSNLNDGRVYSIASYPTWEIYRDAQSSLERLEAWASLTTTFGFESGAESLRGAIHTSGLFSVLGAAPAIGRDFVPGDDLPSSAAVVILSDRLWRSRFGGDPAVLGSTVEIEEEPYNVIGVMPPDFRFPNARTQYWLPMRIAPRRDTTFYLRMLGRVREGLTLEQARVRAEALHLDVPTGSPGETHRTGAVLSSLREEMVGDLRPALLVFLGAVSAVLLIAGLNVANLLLSRAVARRREVALRAALGAGRARIARQFVAESLLLSGVGGLLGVALAGAMVGAVVALAARSMPRPEEIGLDATALVFALALMSLVGLAISLVPAWRASRPDLRESLQQGAHQAAGAARHNRLRHGMIVAQLAATLVLLVGASLFLRSFSSWLDWESGFDPHDVLVLELELPGERYAELSRQEAFYDELVPRLANLPGVGSAAVASSHPFVFNSHERIEPEGYVPAADERTTTESFYVGAEYFDALGMTLRAGRRFEAGDADRALIVNETLARRYFPGGAVGRRMRLGSRTPHWREIVGVVADVRWPGAGREDVAVTYVPYSAAGHPYALTVLARTGVPPLGLGPAIRRAVAEVDRNVPVRGLRRLEDDLWASRAGPRSRAVLLAAFGLAALVLSMVGLYGVMAYWVAQRTRELGVRMALGAGRGRVLRQVIGRGFALTLSGLGIGMLAAGALVRVLESFLFDIEPHDPASFAAAMLGLAAAALAASWIPAWRASRLDPVSALRSE